MGMRTAGELLADAFDHEEVGAVLSWPPVVAATCRCGVLPISRPVMTPVALADGTALLPPQVETLLESYLQEVASISDALAALSYQERARAPRLARANTAPAT